LAQSRSTIAPGCRRWCPGARRKKDFVTQDNLDWYRRFAIGRPAALVVEGDGIRDIPSGRCCASVTIDFCRD